MEVILLGILAICLAVWGFCADRKLWTIRVDGQVYNNVAVFKVTATHIHFLHSRGTGKVELKDLDPEMQKVFGYDSAQAVPA
jgi:hypothetical protein